MKHIMYTKNFEDLGFEIRMIPSTSFILQETRNKLYFMFEIQTQEKKNKTTPKPSFNLALVLDRSGSMQGQKLDFAKNAMNRWMTDYRMD